MNEKYISEGPFYFDGGAFCIWKTRWGTWNSADREGKGLVSGLDRDAVETFAREKINGYPNCWTSDTGVYMTGSDTL